MTLKSVTLGAAVATLMAFGTIGSANAALTYAGQFAGTDCSGGAFANCTASTTGVHQGGEGSPVIYKSENGGGFDFGSFPTIDGSEFSVSFNGTTHVLSWTYTPGAGDPEIHYFTIKQANSYALWYDLLDPILAFTIDLDTIDYNSFSHVSWFDTGSTTTVPEPASLALFGAGLAGLFLTRRRRSA